MKVILLAPTPPPVGGIARWTQRMLETKLKDGWTVEVVDEKLIGGRDVFGANNQKKVFVELKRTLLIWKNLLIAVNKPEAKVVHSNIPASSLSMMREYICAIIANVFKKKFVIHYRCTVPNLVKTKFGKWIYTKLCNISAEIIVLNQESYDFTQQYTETPISIIPNFTEDNHIVNFKKEIRSRVKTVLYTGGVIESKGCIDIIKVASQFPGISFRLAGKIGEEIKKIEIPSNVHLLGVLEKSDVQKELIEADLYMFVSYYEGEGFSNSLVEAMSYGVPCIVSNWAANKDMIEKHGGVVVPVSDLEKMVVALRELDCNPELRKRQSEWNMIKVKKYYSQSVVTSQYVDLYNQLSLQGGEKHSSN